jgi:UPF0716 protein FxsA
MVARLIVVFIVVSIVELAVFAQVADKIGGVPAGLLLVACSLGGAWLVKQQGLRAWRRAQSQLQAGELPAVEMVNGLLLLAAGALLFMPGFVTDGLGLLLLVPPVRAMVRTILLRRYERRVRDALSGAGGLGTPAAGGFATRRVFTGPASMGDVYDVREVDPDPSPRPPSSPSGRSADRPELGRY